MYTYHCVDVSHERIATPRRWRLTGSCSVQSAASDLCLSEIIRINFHRRMTNDPSFTLRAVRPALFKLPTACCCQCTKLFVQLHARSDRRNSVRSSDVMSRDVGSPETEDDRLSATCRTTLRCRIDNY